VPALRGRCFEEPGFDILVDAGEVAGVSLTNCELPVCEDCVPSCCEPPEDEPVDEAAEESGWPCGSSSSEYSSTVGAWVMYWNTLGCAASIPLGVCPSSPGPSEMYVSTSEALLSSSSSSSSISLCSSYVGCVIVLLLSFDALVTSEGDGAAGGSAILAGLSSRCCSAWCLYWLCSRFTA
jgi:hypothetical protein